MSVRDMHSPTHCPTYRGGSGRTPSQGWGMCSFSGSLRPLLVVPSCTWDYASIPTSFHECVERTFTATSGRGYTCPCSCPCCLSPCFWGGVFKELPGALDLPRWQRWNCCTEESQIGRFHPPVLLWLFNVLLSCLSCPAATGCRVSKTQCFSCLLSSLGVWCECTRDAKTACVCVSVSVCVCMCVCVCVCVWMRAAQCRLASASICLA